MTRVIESDRLPRPAQSNQFRQEISPVCDSQRFQTLSNDLIV